MPNLTSIWRAHGARLLVGWRDKGIIRTLPSIDHLSRETRSCLRGSGAGPGRQAGTFRFTFPTLVPSIWQAKGKFRSMVLENVKAHGKVLD